jgi:hypothetical protein
MDWKQNLYNLWQHMGFDAETVAHYERILFQPVDPSKSLEDNAFMMGGRHRLLWLENAGIHQIPHTHDDYLNAWWFAYGMDEHGQHGWFDWADVIDALTNGGDYDTPCVFWNQMDEKEREVFGHSSAIAALDAIGMVSIDPPVAGNVAPVRKTLWRGVGVPKDKHVMTDPYDIGISWTDSLTTADWFAKRYKSDDVDGFVIEAAFDFRGIANQILGVNLGRGEREFLVDTHTVHDLRVRQV